MLNSDCRNYATTFDGNIRVIDYLWASIKASTKPKKLRIMLFFGEQVQSILDEHGGTELLLQSWMRLQLTTIIYR